MARIKKRASITEAKAGRKRAIEGWRKRDEEAEDGKADMEGKPMHSGSEQPRIKT